MNVERQANPEMPTVEAIELSPPRFERIPVRALSLFKLLMQCLLVGALAYGSYSVVTRFILQSVQVVGNSMAPTLENTGHYLLNRWVYLVREPKRADIVVIRDPAD